MQERRRRTMSPFSTSTLTWMAGSLAGRRQPLAVPATAPTAVGTAVGEAVKRAGRLPLQAGISHGRAFQATPVPPLPDGTVRGERRRRANLAAPASPRMRIGSILMATRRVGAPRAAPLLEGLPKLVLFMSGGGQGEPCFTDAAPEAAPGMPSVGEPLRWKPVRVPQRSSRQAGQVGASGPPIRKPCRSTSAPAWLPQGEAARDRFADGPALSSPRVLGSAERSLSLLLRWAPPVRPLEADLGVGASQNGWCRCPIATKGDDRLGRIGVPVRILQ